MTGVLRGKTLVEKAYGPGFRETPHREAVAPWPGCGVEGCQAAVYGSIEMFVDDVPPAVDWYTKILRRLPQQVWVRVKFCQDHLADVTRRSVDEYQEEPDLWAPWRASPPVLTHPPKLIVGK